MDIFPSHIQLTHNLYLQFKLFIFETYYNQRQKQLQLQNSKKKGDGKDSLTQAQDRKYQLLVPSKLQTKQKLNTGNQQLPLQATEEVISNDSKSSSIGGNTKMNQNSSMSNHSGSKTKLGGEKKGKLDEMKIVDMKKSNQNIF